MAQEEPIQFRAVRSRTIALMQDLSQAQLDYRPQPDEWSIGEVMEHLIALAADVALRLGRSKTELCDGLCAIRHETETLFATNRPLIMTTCGLNTYRLASKRCPNSCGPCGCTNKRTRIKAPGCVSAPRFPGLYERPGPTGPQACGVQTVVSHRWPCQPLKFEERQVELLRLARPFLQCRRAVWGLKGRVQEAHRHALT
jgi:hypothetical protein